MVLILAAVTVLGACSDGGDKGDPEAFCRQVSRGDTSHVERADAGLEPEPAIDPSTGEPFTEEDLQWLLDLSRDAYDQTERDAPPEIRPSVSTFNTAQLAVLGGGEVEDLASVRTAATRIDDWIAANCS